MIFSSLFETLLEAYKIPLATLIQYFSAVCFLSQCLLSKSDLPLVVKMFLKKTTKLNNVQRHSCQARKAIFNQQSL